MKKAFVIFCLLGLSILSFAQKNKIFSEDPVEFFSEFSKYLKDAKNKGLNETLDQFTLFWEGGNFGYEAEEKFISTVNIMRKNRYIPHPDFNNLLSATNSFFQNEIDEETFVQFLSVTDTLIKLGNSKTEVKSFIKFFETFNSKKILAGKGGKEWAVDDLSYSLKMNKAPYIELEGVLLSCQGKKDTFYIDNTSGRFYIKSHKWWGREGEVTWERVGLSSSDVYANLGHYKINMDNSGYQADSVEFYNLDAQSDAIAGKLKDDLDGRGEKASFPQFRSYKRKFNLEDLDYYIEYKGGFGMEGQTIVGSGAGYNPARIVVFKDDKKFMNLYSYNFYIQPDVIKAGKCAVSIFIDQDSIYHPEMVLNIDREAAHITLTLSPEAPVITPFNDTYHQLDIYADQFDCHLDSSYFDILSYRDPDGRATFESLNYFSRKRFEKLRGNMAYNPIFKMNELYTLYQKRVYSEDELVSFFGIDRIEEIQTLLMIMATQGYIIYDTKMKEIYLQDKLFTYINAYLRKIDFDVIQLNSVSKNKPNSRFYFETKDLEIRGISKVQLSDSQNVEIYPAKKTIIFKKNRDMSFDGYMRAGRFEYFGKKFEFSYEDFQINMNQIDSMMFNFPDAANDDLLRRVNTVIQNITGNLQIDKPDNKSGRLSAPNFPIFDCTKGAYVYYDYKSVFNKVYDRERFYFKLKPFVVDSLDNFSMKGMNLKGTFVSAKILPEFDYRLTLQPDFSLGFATEAPEDGYPLYSGTGRCYMKIFLSNKGLRGNGRFTYNGAEIESEDMIFFPDSMEAMQTVFAMDDAERKKFPDVNSQNCELSWTPYRDTMIIAAVDSTAFINMYEEESFLKGRLVFTKQNMYGSGEFNYRQGIAYSDYYNFKHKTLAADSTQFTLYQEDMVNTVLSNDSVSIKIDFDKQKLKAETNSDEVMTQLLLNQYSTNIPFFTWDVQEKKVYLDKGEGNDDLDFFFVSTNPTFDSLTFSPKSAELDLTDYSLEAHDIAYFEVADSRVKPSTSVQIGENGVIPALENAEILASVENEYHKITNATVNIFGSKRLTAGGTYQYTDPNEIAWEIPMPDIRTTEEGITRGIGNIPDSMNFHFGPNIGYNGNLIFESNRKEIEFSGEVNIEHPHIEYLTTEKFRFDGLVSFDSLFFNVTEAKNILGQELHTGIFLNTKTKKLYPVFLGLKQTPDDIPVYRAEGDLYYDIDSSMFVIAPFERYYDEDLRFGRWIFDVDTNMMTMDGALDFEYKIENIDITLSGYLTHEISKKETKMYMMGGVDFPLEPAAVKVMSDSIINFGFFNTDVNNYKNYIASSVMRNLPDEKAAGKAYDNLYKTGNIPTSKEYEPFFFFTETELIWDSTSKSFTNPGSIGLANLNQYNVNKNINGKIDFFKTGFRDSVSIYIETNPGNWYLFTFVEEELFLDASDIEFVKRALDKKPKELTGRMSYKRCEEEMIEATRQKAIRIETE
jgi:hypothetical protein